MTKLEEVLGMSPQDKDQLILQKLGVGGSPSTNAGDDIAVHMKVCEIWDCQGLLGNYFHALEELLSITGEDEPDENPSLYSLMYYYPGMFSTVALFVVLHYEGWSESDVAKRLVAARRAKMDGEAFPEHGG